MWEEKVGIRAQSTVGGLGFDIVPGNSVLLVLGEQTSSGLQRVGPAELSWRSGFLKSPVRYWPLAHASYLSPRHVEGRGGCSACCPSQQHAHGAAEWRASWTWVLGGITPGVGMDRWALLPCVERRVG